MRLFSSLIFLAFFLFHSKEVKGDNLWEYDEFLGWRNKSNFYGYFPAFMGFPGFIIRINKNGFRDEIDWEDRVIKSKRKILILGDSVCFGFGLDFKDTVGEQLEKMLGDNFIVLNMSVVGYSTDQELILFEREGIRYNPEFVVFCLWVNDIAGVMDSEPLENGRGKPVFINNKGDLVLLNVPVKHESIFPQRYYEMFSIIYGKYTLEYYLGKKPSVLKRNFEYFLRRYITYRFFHIFHKRILYEYINLLYIIMTRAKKICEEKNCRLILLLIPDYHMAYGINKHARKIYQMIEEKIKIIPVSYVEMNKDDFFRENLHPNASGHRKIAEKIFSMISQLTK